MVFILSRLQGQNSKINVYIAKHTNDEIRMFLWTHFCGSKMDLQTFLVLVFLFKLFQSNVQNQFIIRHSDKKRINNNNK